MSKYNAIKINKGPSGFGGPLTVQPTEEKNVLLYITGGGAKPDIVDKIVELTGCEAVNGFKTSEPEQIFLVIIDCGGTLRCGIYPQKRIPTINVMPVGKSGPLAKFITEDIYVSAVGLDEIEPAGEVAPATNTSAVDEVATTAEVLEKDEEKECFESICCRTVYGVCGSDARMRQKRDRGRESEGNSFRRCADR